MAAGPIWTQWQSQLNLVGGLEVRAKGRDQLLPHILHMLKMHRAIYIYDFMY